MEVRAWVPDDERASDHLQQFQRSGIKLKHVYRDEDLAAGKVIFSTAAITDNSIMHGVYFERGGRPRVSFLSGDSRGPRILRGERSWR